LSSATPEPQLLILGLGNVLCADDGLGVEAVLRLHREYRLPEGVQALDGGTLGLSLLGYLAEAPRVILVDAVRTGGAPGDAVRLTGEDVAPAVRERLSVHQVGVSDLLDGLRLIDAYPRVMVLLGLVPARLDLSLDRSPEVVAALPELVRRVAAEAAALGFPLLPREEVDGRAENATRRDRQAVDPVAGWSAEHGCVAGGV
jgi:hydrogenase maturation protease